MSQVIAPAGGIVQSDGLTLEFPAGALGRRSQEVAVVSRSAASGVIAAFRLEPAGRQLQQPVTLSYTAESLPANARLFWNIDGALRLMPGIPSGNSLRTTVTSLGYAAGGRRVMAQEGARAQRLGAAGRARALAEGEQPGTVEVRLLQCEVQAADVQRRLAATDWYRDQDLAIALHDELVALNASCADLQLQALEQRTCDALTTAVDAAAVVAIDSLPAFEGMVVSLHNAAAMVQNMSAVCAAAGGLPPETRVDRLIEAKFDQLLTFVDARAVAAGFAGTAGQQEVVALMNLSAHCERLGLVAPCARLTGDLYPRVLNILRNAAFLRCRSGETAEPARLMALGQDLSTPQKFFGFASYGPAALEADAMSCTNPGLSVKVFQTTATGTEELPARARTIDALGAPDAYNRTASFKVPTNGILSLTGRAQALRCADGTASRADLVVRLSGIELKRYVHDGTAYPLAAPPLEVVLERDLARLGLPVAPGTRVLTVVREGGGCDLTDEPFFDQPFPLFELTLEIEAMTTAPPPPALPAAAWAGTITLRYDFVGTWETVNRRSDGCANDLDSGTTAVCATTDSGSNTGSVFLQMAVDTPSAIDIGGTGGELRLRIQSVTGSMAGSRATGGGGSDGPCTVSNSSAYTRSAVVTGATPRRNWALTVGRDGRLHLSTGSTLQSPRSIDIALRGSNVGAGTSLQSAGCPGGARTTTSGNSTDNPVLLVPPADWGGTVDPAGPVWQGSEARPFAASGALCNNLGNLVGGLLQIPGHSGTASCTGTLTATWDLQRR